MSNELALEEQLLQIRHQLQVQEEANRSLTVRLERTETEKHLLEQQLSRFQMLEHMGDIAVGTAHDLNNILSGIATLPDLLLMTIDLNERQKRAVEMIKHSGKRAAELVADMALLARGIEDEKESLDINILVKTCLMSPECKAIQNSHPLLQVVTDLSAEPLRIEGSFAIICKALTNLFQNAAAPVSQDASEEKRVVVIQTRREQTEKSDTGGAGLRPGQFVVLSVSDDGPGLADPDKECIFNPFYVRKVMRRNGTGLGMTIVRHVAQIHHGRIEIDSGEGGNRIQLYFPSVPTSS